MTKGILQCMLTQQKTPPACFSVTVSSFTAEGTQVCPPLKTQFNYDAPAH